MERITAGTSRADRPATPTNSRLLPPLVSNVDGLQRAREKRGVVGSVDVAAAVGVGELDEAYNLGCNGLQLDVGKLLANAAVTAGAEGKVGRVGTLADEAVTVVDLLLVSALGARKGRCIGRVGEPAVRGGRKNAGRP
ncbi:hypothetical protein HYQ46_005821 [Verticillium longisporum]|nr:hypothetical protein HYQ46_005821 [Verticillium longisporum]